ncbi:MAG: hypothetical protein Ct9H300mP28_31680 [Pseudomonadota bacterium]|nr:MAG: hypothetical protein Ct9H300mP28_31680 [Pseudomonadota bacterium]
MSLSTGSPFVQAKISEMHVTSFNWGPWEGGMVTPELKRLFEDRNVEVISGLRRYSCFCRRGNIPGQENPIV